MKYIFMLSTILFSFFIHGCISKTTYPNQWGETQQLKNNQILQNGIYQCKGEYSSEAYPDIHQAYIPRFFGIEDIELQRCDSFHIKQLNVDTIQITMYYKNNTTHRKSLKLNTDYFINFNNELYITNKNEYASTNGVIAIAFSKSYISYNKDKDLIIKYTRSAVGTVLIVIPVGGYEEHWVLFKNLTSIHNKK